MFHQIGIYKAYHSRFIWELAKQLGAVKANLRPSKNSFTGYVLEILFDDAFAVSQFAIFEREVGIFFARRLRDKGSKMAVSVPCLP